MSNMFENDVFLRFYAMVIRDSVISAAGGAVPEMCEAGDAGRSVFEDRVVEVLRDGDREIAAEVLVGMVYKAELAAMSEESLDQALADGFDEISLLSSGGAHGFH